VGTSNSPQTLARQAATWGDVYNGPALSAVPWYTCGSFQDWSGNITAERGLTEGVSGRWQFPTLWHTFTVDVEPSYNTLQIIMVDTVTLTGLMRNNPLPTPPGGFQPPSPPVRQQSAGSDGGGQTGFYTDADVHSDTGASHWTGQAPAPAPAATPPPATSDADILAGFSSAGGAGAAAYGAGTRRRKAGRRLQDFNLRNNPPISSAQWRWLTHVVNTSTADWLIVVGNDPIWSAGEHGPTWRLVDDLLPLLDAHGAALYIGGRDPLSQHFKPTAQFSNVDVITVGNGAAGNASMAALLPSAALNPPGSLAFVFGNDTGFVTINLTPPGPERPPSTLTVTFFDSQATELYSFSKQNNRTPPDPFGGHGVATTAPVQLRHEKLWLLSGAAVFFLGGGGYFAYLAASAPEEAPKRVRRSTKARAGAGELRPLLGGRRGENTLDDTGL